MNTNLKLIHVFLILVFFSTNGLAQRPELPFSDDAEEFGREVERFVMAISESGEGFTNPYNRTREELIKDDSRDWEKALTRMIGAPDEYGLTVSQGALEVARMRQTESRPEIVKAVIRLFHAHVEQTLEKIAETTARGEEVPDHVNVPLSGFLTSILRLGNPEILQTVLVYMNSAEEKKIGVLDQHTSPYIAGILQKYGAAAHLDEAGKLVKLLEEKGRNDIADDIQRTLKRIGRDHGNEGMRRDIRKNVGSTAVTARKAAPEAKPWGGIPSVWVAVLIGTLVIVAGGVGWILFSSRADGRE